MDSEVGRGPIQTIDVSTVSGFSSITAMANPKEPKLKKTKWGFYRYEPKPSDEELQAYYAEKYYQEGQWGYEVSYTDE